MTFTVRELPKAKEDKRSIFLWLHEHSPAGAMAWLDAYDALLVHLSQHADSFGVALERPDCELPIRQALFKTRRGRVYRAVYFIERSDVFVLRVRGPGQAPMTPQDLAT
jgi:hypothetical protein